jgi:hypothetical protein
MKRLLLLLLFAASIASAQTDRGIKVFQVQLAGTTIYTRGGGLVVLNCSTGMSCVVSGRGVDMSVGGAGATISADAFISTTASPSTTGLFRLASADCIKWRSSVATDLGLCKTGAVSGNFPADSLDITGFGGIKFDSQTEIRPVGGGFAFVTSGNLNGAISTNQPGYFETHTLGGYCWSSSSTDPTGTVGTCISRGSADATIKFGFTDAAAPVAQTISVQQPTATNSNQAGGQTTFQAQAGTGTGIPGPWVVQGGSTNTASGATIQTMTNRHIVGDVKALTTGAATTVLSIPMASLATTGGTLRYHIWATDGTSQCTSDNIVVFNGENSAGVFVVTATKAMTSVTSCTAAKTLTEAWTITSANPSLLQVTPTLTGITATTFKIVYSVDYFGDTQPTL